MSADLRSAPLVAQVTGIVLVLANAAALVQLFLRAEAFMGPDPRLGLLLLFVLEALGLLAIVGGALVFLGRRLGVWLLMVALPAQGLVNSFAGLPDLRVWLPLAALVVVMVLLFPVRGRLR